MENQEILFKLSMMEQQIRQLQEQIQAVESSLIDIDYLKNSLDELKGSTEKEILSPIGKGIFIKSKVLSEELILDVGDRKFVKKDIEGTKDMLGKQIKKLEEIKLELESNLDKLGEEVNKIISENH